MNRMLDVTAVHTPSLFETLIAAAMAAFDALHDARWTAPWGRQGA